MSSLRDPRECALNAEKRPPMREEVSGDAAHVYWWPYQLALPGPRKGWLTSSVALDSRFCRERKGERKLTEDVRIRWPHEGRRQRRDSLLSLSSLDFLRGDRLRSEPRPTLADRSRDGRRGRRIRFPAYPLVEKTHSLGKTHARKLILEIFDWKQKDGNFTRKK